MADYSDIPPDFSGRKGWELIDATPMMEPLTRLEEFTKAAMQASIIADGAEAQRRIYGKPFGEHVIKIAKSVIEAIDEETRNPQER